MTEQTARERFLRVDQEWRIAVAKARLNHADLATDLRIARGDRWAEPHVELEVPTEVVA